MTHKERAQVVELLRCAADELLCGRYVDDGFRPFTFAVQAYATSAWVHELCCDEPSDEEATHEEAALVMLAAALRVENGEWPVKGGGR